MRSFVPQLLGYTGQADEEEKKDEEQRKGETNRIGGMKGDRKRVKKEENRGGEGRRGEEQEGG